MLLKSNYARILNLKPKLFLVLWFLPMVSSAVWAGEWLECKKRQVLDAKIDCSKYETSQTTKSNPPNPSPKKDD